jgi:hypothetical protein
MVGFARVLTQCEGAEMDTVLLWQVVKLFHCHVLNPSSNDFF